MQPSLSFDSRIYRPQTHPVAALRAAPLSARDLGGAACFRPRSRARPRASSRRRALAAHTAARARWCRPRQGAAVLLRRRLREEQSVVSLAATGPLHAVDQLLHAAPSDSERVVVVYNAKGMYRLLLRKLMICTNGGDGWDSFHSHGYQSVKMRSNCRRAPGQLLLRPARAPPPSLLSSPPSHARSSCLNHPRLHSFSPPSTPLLPPPSLRVRRPRVGRRDARAKLEQAGAVLKVAFVCGVLCCALLRELRVALVLACAPRRRRRRAPSHSTRLQPQPARRTGPLPSPHHHRHHHCHHHRHRPCITTRHTCSRRAAP